MKSKPCSNCGVFAEALGFCSSSSQSLCEYCKHDDEFHKGGSPCSCAKELIYGPALVEALRNG